MAKLNDQPGSSTAKQRQLLHKIKRRRGMTDDDLHSAIGAESTTQLSAAEASAAIERLSGRGLPHPPGQKPSPYAGKRRAPGTIRMITEDQVDQIVRLGSGYFDNYQAFAAWLVKDFKVPEIRGLQFAGLRNLIRGLATAARAGQVIAVLKTMTTRKEID